MTEDRCFCETSEDFRYFNRHLPTITLYYWWQEEGDESRVWFEPIEDET